MTGVIRAAERARTIVDCAGDAVVSCLAMPAQRVFHLAFDAQGSLIMSLPPGHPLLETVPELNAHVVPAQRVKGGNGVTSESTVLVEVVDLIARPVADRVRARVVIIGTMTRLGGQDEALARTLIHAQPPRGTVPPASGAAAIANLLSQGLPFDDFDSSGRDDHVLVRVNPQAIAVGEPNRKGSINLDTADVAVAMVDPIAAHEAIILDYIAIGYRNSLESLAREVSKHSKRRGGPIPNQRTAMGVDPIAVDRYGMTIRVWPDIMAAHLDVRIDFAHPVLNFATALDAVSAAMEAPTASLAPQH